MSTNTLTPPVLTSSQAKAAAGTLRLTFPRVVRSEWIEFRTLRSTMWTLASTVVVIVGIVVLFCIMINSNSGGGGDQGTVGPETSIVAFSLAAGIAQLAVAVLGVLVITGEYTAGMIRSTLAAVPRRLPALWAKGVVLAVLPADRDRGGVARPAGGWGR